MMSGPIIAMGKKYEMDFHLSGNRMALVDPLALPFAKFDTGYQTNYSKVESCLSGSSYVSSNYLPQIIPQSNAIQNQEILDKPKLTPTLFELQSSRNNSTVDQRRDSSVLNHMSRSNTQYYNSDSSPTPSKKSTCITIQLSDISQGSKDSIISKDENVPLCPTKDFENENSHDTRNEDTRHCKPQEKFQEEQSDVSSVHSHRLRVKKKNKRRKRSAKRKSRLKQASELKEKDPFKDDSDISIFGAVCKPIAFTNTKLMQEMKKPALKNTVLKSTVVIYQNTNQHNNPGPGLSKSMESGVHKIKTTIPAHRGNSSKKQGKVPQTAPVSTSHNSLCWRDIASKEILTDGSSEPGKITKVYLSEKRSKSITEKGTGTEFPGAPPATPMPDMLKRYEYVPSLNDIRSQRAVKVRLEHIEKIEQKKKAKEKEEKLKKEKIELKEKEQKLKQQQRREIYALNKKMTEFENKNFVEFCKAHDIPSTL